MEQEELGRYRLSGKLGEGAMGVVYRGFDPLLERTVAIKTIKLDLGPAERADFEKRFFLEAKSAARLSHPNIVTVFDAGEAGEVAYIAMEFLEGEDLRQMMIPGLGLAEDWAADIVAAIAEGLAYAHREGVVHRDVKPANIMVLKNGGVKLADFGIAHLQTGAKTQTSTLLGTPKYMSPEQISGQPVDGRADIFSLGVVLYQLLTGTVPFDGEAMAAVMYQVLHCPALPPTRHVEHLHPGFAHILSRALAKKPEDRYQTASEFAADLRRYRKLGKSDPLPWPTGGLGDPETCLPPGEGGARPATAAPAPTRASRLRWPLAALAVALLLGLGGYLASRPAPPPPAESRATATLSLAVTPWGEIFVDGESRGISPPLLELPLPPGRHRIEIRNEGAKPFRQDIVLQEGDSLRLKHKF